MSSVLNLNWMTLSLRPLSSDFFKFPPLRVAKMINFAMFYTRGPKVLYVSFTMEDPKSRATQKKLATCTLLMAALIYFSQNRLKTQKWLFLKKLSTDFEISW